MLVKWKDLASILNNLEKLNIFQQETFNQFRRVCWWGLGVIILDAAVFVIGVIALPTLFADVTIWLKLFTLFGFHLSLLYPMSAFILIFCLCRMVSIMLNTIGYKKQCKENS